MSKLKAQPQWLRVGTMGALGVDRENNVIRGMVIAQEGNFKSAGRGAFDLKSLKQIKALMNKQPAGLKSRMSHPTLSADGIGKFLGRVKNPELSTVQVMRDGKLVALHAIRGDNYIDKTALEEPVGGGRPLGDYIMALAESDPDALSSSLVLDTDQEEQLDPVTKKPKLDANGEPLPPLWRPLALHASDIVDTGDAVDGLLSAELGLTGLPDEMVRRGAELLDRAFPDTDRDVIAARIDAWKDAYLSHRFGEALAAEPVPETKPEEKTIAPEAKGMSKDVADLRLLLAQSEAR